MSVINIIKLMMASTLTCMVYACDFTEKNIDPNSPTSIEPGPLLTYTQLHTTTGGIAKNIQVGTCMMLVQQAASLNNDARLQILPDGILRQHLLYRHL